MKDESVIKKNWEKFKNEIQKKWDKITGEDLDKTDGKVDSIGNLYRERYGTTHEEGKRRVTDFTDTLFPEDELDQVPKRSGTTDY